MSTGAQVVTPLLNPIPTGVGKHRDKGKTGREKCRVRGNPTLPYVSGKKEFMVEIFISLVSKTDINHVSNEVCKIMHRNKASLCFQVTV